MTSPLRGRQTRPAAKVKIKPSQISPPKFNSQMEALDFGVPGSRPIKRARKTAAPRDQVVQGFEDVAFQHVAMADTRTAAGTAASTLHSTAGHRSTNLTNANKTASPLATREALSPNSGLTNQLRSMLSSKRGIKGDSRAISNFMSRKQTATQQAQRADTLSPFEHAKYLAQAQTLQAHRKEISAHNQNSHRTTEGLPTSNQSALDFLQRQQELGSVGAHAGAQAHLQRYQTRSDLVEKGPAPGGVPSAHPRIDLEERTAVLRYLHDVRKLPPRARSTGPRRMSTAERHQQIKQAWGIQLGRPSPDKGAKPRPSASKPLALDHQEDIPSEGLQETSDVKALFTKWRDEQFEPSFAEAEKQGAQLAQLATVSPQPVLRVKPASNRRQVQIFQGMRRPQKPIHSSELGVKTSQQQQEQAQGRETSQPQSRVRLAKPAQRVQTANQSLVSRHSLFRKRASSTPGIGLRQNGRPPAMANSPFSGVLNGYYRKLDHNSKRKEPNTSSSRIASLAPPHLTSTLLGQMSPASTDKLGTPTLRMPLRLAPDSISNSQSNFNGSGRQLNSSGAPLYSKQTPSEQTQSQYHPHMAQQATSMQPEEGSQNVDMMTQMMMGFLLSQAFRNNTIQNLVINSPGAYTMSSDGQHQGVPHQNVPQQAAPQRQQQQQPQPRQPQNPLSSQPTITGDSCQRSQAAQPQKHHGEGSTGNGRSDTTFTVNDAFLRDLSAQLQGSMQPPVSQGQFELQIPNIIGRLPDSIDLGTATRQASSSLSGQRAVTATQAIKLVDQSEMDDNTNDARISTITRPSVDELAMGPSQINRELQMTPQSPFPDANTPTDEVMAHQAPQLPGGNGASQDKAAESVPQGEATEHHTVIKSIENPISIQIDSLEASRAEQHAGAGSAASSRADHQKIESAIVSTQEAPKASSQEESFVPSAILDTHVSPATPQLDTKESEPAALSSGAEIKKLSEPASEERILESESNEGDLPSQGLIEPDLALRKQSSASPERRRLISSLVPPLNLGLAKDLQQEMVDQIDDDQSQEAHESKSPKKSHKSSQDAVPEPPPPREPSATTSSKKLSSRNPDTTEVSRSSGSSSISAQSKRPKDGTTAKSEVKSEQKPQEEAKKSKGDPGELLSATLTETKHPPRTSNSERIIVERDDKYDDPQGFQKLNTQVEMMFKELSSSSGSNRSLNDRRTRKTQIIEERVDTSEATSRSRHTFRSRLDMSELGADPPTSHQSLNLMNLPSQVGPLQSKSSFSKMDHVSLGEESSQATDMKAAVLPLQHTSENSVSRSSRQKSDDSLQPDDSEKARSRKIQTTLLLPTISIADETQKAPALAAIQVQPQSKMKRQATVSLQQDPSGLCATNRMSLLGSQKSHQLELSQARPLLSRRNATSKASSRTEKRPYLSGASRKTNDLRVAPSPRNQLEAIEAFYHSLSRRSASSHRSHQVSNKGAAPTNKKDIEAIVNLVFDQLDSKLSKQLAQSNVKDPSSLLSNLKSTVMKATKKKARRQTVAPNMIPVEQIMAINRLQGSPPKRLSRRQSSKSVRPRREDRLLAERKCSRSDTTPPSRSQRSSRVFQSINVHPLAKQKKADLEQSTEPRRALLEKPPCTMGTGDLKPVIQVTALSDRRRRSKTKPDSVWTSGEGTVKLMLVDQGIHETLSLKRVSIANSSVPPEGKSSSEQASSFSSSRLRDSSSQLGSSYYSSSSIESSFESDRCSDDLLRLVESFQAAKHETLQRDKIPAKLNEPSILKPTSRQSSGSTSSHQRQRAVVTNPARRLYRQSTFARKKQSTSFLADSIGPVKAVAMKQICRANSQEQQEPLIVSRKLTSKVFSRQITLETESKEGTRQQLKDIRKFEANLIEQFSVISDAHTHYRPICITRSPEEASSHEMKEIYASLTEAVHTKFPHGVSKGETSHLQAPLQSRPTTMGRSPRSPAEPPSRNKEGIKLVPPVPISMEKAKSQLPATSPQIRIEEPSVGSSSILIDMSRFLFSDHSNFFESECSGPVVEPNSPPNFFTGPPMAKFRGSSVNRRIDSLHSQNSAAVVLKSNTLAHEQKKAGAQSDFLHQPTRKIPSQRTMIVLEMNEALLAEALPFRDLVESLEKKYAQTISEDHSLLEEQAQIKHRKNRRLSVMYSLNSIAKQQKMKGNLHFTTLGVPSRTGLGKPIISPFPYGQNGAPSGVIQLSSDKSAITEATEEAILTKEDKVAALMNMDTGTNFDFFQLLLIQQTNQMYFIQVKDCEDLESVSLIKTRPLSQEAMEIIGEPDCDMPTRRPMMRCTELLKFQEKYLNYEDVGFVSESLTEYSRKQKSMFIYLPQNQSCANFVEELSKTAIMPMPVPAKPRVARMSPQLMQMIAKKWIEGNFKKIRRKMAFKKQIKRKEERQDKKFQTFEMLVNGRFRQDMSLKVRRRFSRGSTIERAVDDYIAAHAMKLPLQEERRDYTVRRINSFVKSASLTYYLFEAGPNSYIRRKLRDRQNSEKLFNMLWKKAYTKADDIYINKVDRRTMARPSRMIMPLH